MSASGLSIAQIQVELASRDPHFARFIADGVVSPIDQPLHTSDFETLVFAVIGQQVSAKAADAMTTRLLDALGDRVRPENIRDFGYDSLLGLGFTRAKSRTMTEMADAIIDGSLDLDAVAIMPDAQAVAELSKLWGIGRWTSEMYLLFRLGRLNIWPTGDLAVRRGWAIINGWSDVPTPEQMESTADHLAPYRSVVAWHCWRATGETSMYW